MIKSPTAIDSILAAASEKWPDRPFIVFENRPYSYATIERRVDEAARGLMTLGVQAGDRVALWMSNRVEWIIAQFAVTRLGAVLVPLNTRLRSVDITHMLRDSGSVVLITQHHAEGFSYLDIVREVIADGQCTALSHVVVAAPDDDLETPFLSWDTLLDSSNVHTPVPETDVNAMAYILYTSGTTGLPKGVMLSHCNLNNCFNLSGQMTDGDVFFLSYPLFAITGCHNTILACALIGGTVVLQERFEPAEAVALIERYKCTWIGGHITAMEQLVGSSAFDSKRLASLRGGRIFPRRPQHLPLLNKLGIEYAASGFGLTESAGPLVNNCGLDKVTLSSEGQPWPGNQIEIRDPEGNVLPAGEEGIIFAKSPQIMLGYFNNPEATARALTEDGWLRTGDMGKLDDDGNLTFISRYDDVYKCMGFNVAGDEVEAFLSGHPDIEDVAVIGVPDDSKGAVGAAFVIPKSGANVSLENVVGFCKGQIASYKTPGHVVCVSDFPRTAMGKVRKRELRQTHFQET
jgi:acyl-CoA synthetase (AMP-forming)/AMP-acid ligase II